MQVQIEFGDINAIFDDLTTMLKVLGLRVNMNQCRREAHSKDDARDQPVPELFRANRRGQYEFWYSFDEED